jgi:hypothetical protein
LCRAAFGLPKRLVFEDVVTQDNRARVRTTSRRLLGCSTLGDIEERFEWRGSDDGKVGTELKRELRVRSKRMGPLKKRLMKMYLSRTSRRLMRLDREEGRG